MSELFDDAAEPEWAAARFRPYLLGQLELDDAQRVATAVALIPGFIDQLDQFEEDLIEAYLDLRLGPVEKTAFETEYERGADAEKLAKLRLHEALRSPELRQLIRSAQPEPEQPERPQTEAVPSERDALKSRIPRRPFWSWQTAALGAACAAAIMLAALYQNQSQKLNDALTKLNPKQAPPASIAEPPAAVEQPAGVTSTGGLVLPPASGTVQTEKPPSSVIYSPVPDYRQQYEIRIYAASGQVASSGALVPKDNAVEYSPANAQALALPWDVFVIEPPGNGPPGNGPPGNQAKMLAHYVLKP
jgi:hypothetical protein